jgi:hypothetical protein
MPENLWYGLADQPRPPSGLGLSPYRPAGTSCGNRGGQVVGACLRRRSGEHRLAPSGKARRFHQSEARAARFWRPCSLGQTAVRPCGLGATSRLPVAVGPTHRAAAGAPCRRPCSLFDQRPGSRSKHRCRAGQRHLPWLYAALEDRRPLSATRLEHRRSLGRPSSVVAGNAGVPRRDHSPARQPAFPPPSPSSGRLPAPHPRAGCFSRPRGRAV